MPQGVYLAAAGLGRGRCLASGSGLNPFWKWHVLALLALLGTLFVQVRQIAYGVALDWDSSYYISYASNLLAGEGLIAFDYGNHSLYPPLYTLLLAASTSLAGLTDPHEVAGPLNAGIFGMTVFVVGHYLHMRLQWRPFLLATWAALAVVLSVPLGGQAAFALSEPLFILLSTIALVCADRFIADGRQVALIWAAVFSALAWQVRYLGVAVLLAVSLMLSLLPGYSLHERLRNVGTYLVIVALPMAVWLLRNVMVGDMLFGERVRIEYSLPSVMGEAAGRLLDWTQLGESASGMWPDALPALPTAVVLAAVGGLVAIGWRPKHTPFDWRPTLLFGSFGVVYFLLLVVAISFSYAVDGILKRYVTPLYIPLLLVAMFVLDRSLATPTERGQGAARQLAWRVASATLLVLGLAVSAVLNVRDIKSVNLDGADDSINPVLANWGVLDYVRQHLADEWLFSNAEELMHLVTGDPSPASDLSLVVEETMYVAPGAYAVFVNWHRLKKLQFEQPSPFEAANLLEWSNLDLVVELPDGSIWHSPELEPTEQPLEAQPLAHFFNERAPTVNTPLQASLVSECGRADGRNPWRWEVGSHQQGWRPATRRRAGGGSFLFTPTDEEVGLRLRASVYCIDRDGTRVRATTRASLPVQRRVGFEFIAKTLFQPWLHGEPVVRSDFDVYLHNRKLFFHKAPCAAPDIAAPFFLHFEPTHAGNLPRSRRGYGFANFDFPFRERGTIIDNQCLGAFPLPAYAIASIQTGQVSAAGEELWRASILTGGI